MLISELGIGMPLAGAAMCLASTVVTMKSFQQGSFVYNAVSSTVGRVRALLGRMTEIRRWEPRAAVKRSRPTEADVEQELRDGARSSRIHEIGDFPKRRRIEEAEIIGYEYTELEVVEHDDNFHYHYPVGHGWADAGAAYEAEEDVGDALPDMSEAAEAGPSAVPDGAPRESEIPAAVAEEEELRDVARDGMPEAPSFPNDVAEAIPSSAPASMDDLAISSTSANVRGAAASRKDARDAASSQSGIPVRRVSQTSNDGQRLLSRIPKPTPLQHMGYRFDRNGVLREMHSGEQFTFVDQEHYDRLGEAITIEIYQLMQKEGLVAVRIPFGAKTAPRTRIFVTKRILDYMKTGVDAVDKVLVLVHGSGAVRAGQWARSLIINNNLSVGSMLPYIREAKRLGYDVIVTNGNDAAVKKCPGNEKPAVHLQYVWKKLISKLKTDLVAFVAHSAGGAALVEMFRHLRDARAKTFAIALTDSVHPDKLRFGHRFFREVSRHWVVSKFPLGEPVDLNLIIPEVSAGHTKHEWTSGIAFPDVFRFLAARLTATLAHQQEEAENAAEAEAAANNDLDSTSNLSERGSDVDRLSVSSSVNYRTEDASRDYEGAQGEGGRRAEGQPSADEEVANGDAHDANGAGNNVPAVEQVAEEEMSSV